MLLFFFLFLKSRYIHRIVCALGLSASVIWTALYLANLIFPEQHKAFQYVSWPLMTVAIVTTGLWLVLFAVKSQSRGGRPVHENAGHA